MDHRKIEERSLALHREIARRLRADPKHLEAVRERLADDVRSGKYSSLSRCRHGRVAQKY
jgi:hypothetical protein